MTRCFDMFVLDTDHLSLLDRESGPAAAPTAGAGLRVSWRVGRFFVVGLTGNGQAGSGGAVPDGAGLGGRGPVVLITHLGRPHPRRRGCHLLLTLVNVRVISSYRCPLG